mgnify:CR=1 FL=1
MARRVLDGLPVDQGDARELPAGEADLGAAVQLQREREIGLLDAPTVGFRQGGVGLLDLGLAGGGALLRGLATRLSEETGMTVKVAKHPMACVARGAGLVLEDLDALATVLASTQRVPLAARG